MAEIGIFSLPEGEDAKGDVPDAEPGTLVDRDSLGAGDPPPPDEGNPSIACALDGEAEGLRRDVICCKDGKRDILGLP